MSRQHTRHANDDAAEQENFDSRLIDTAFDDYLDRIKTQYKIAGETDVDVYMETGRTTLTDLEPDGEVAAVVIGGMHREFVSKSASTVEADIREMFGYRDIIRSTKLRRPRRKPKKVKKLAKRGKKTAAATKSSKTSKTRRGGDELIDDFIVAVDQQGDTTDSDDHDHDAFSETLNEPIDETINETINETLGAANKPAARGTICTLVMCGDKYIPGALVLAKSVHDKTSCDIWCMYTDDVSMMGVEALSRCFDRCILVPYIEHDVAPMRSQKQRSIYGGWIGKSFTKWNIFDEKLFPVDKVLFMDADMICVDTIDDLFDLDADIAATFSSPWVKPWANHGMNPYYRSDRSLQHGELVSHDDIRAGLTDSIVGIASMVLVRPSAATLQEIRRLITLKAVYGNTACVSGADEQVLAEAIINLGLSCKNIHQSYNWLVGKTEWLEGKQPKTYHYYNKKPWQKSPDHEPEWDDEKTWWAVADSLCAESADPILKQWFTRVPSVN